MLKKTNVICLCLTVLALICCSMVTNTFAANVINPKPEEVGPGRGLSSGPVYTSSDRNLSTSAPYTSIRQSQSTNNNAQLDYAQALQIAMALQAEQERELAMAQSQAAGAVDIQSGYTANGFAYGLARLAHNLSLKRGNVEYVSASKIKDKQYLVVCKSPDHFANGTFLVDIYGVNEDELKDGYQLWFGLYDNNMIKIGTAQVKKMHN